jgi:hypothetical protein
MPQWRETPTRAHILTAYGLEQISVGVRHAKPVTNPEVEFNSDGT